MHTAIATFPARRLAPAWARALRFVGLNAAIWSGFSVVMALTFLSDDLRRGVHGSFWLILRSTGASAMVLAALGMLIYLALGRWPTVLASAKGVLAGYLLILLLVLPSQLIFLAKLYLREDGPGLSWAAIARQVEAIDRFTSMLAVSTVTAVYIAVVGIKIWQQNQQRARAWAQAQAEAMATRLELERQRGLALRAQLEPHFMFNALNAISALVRSDSKDAALDGIQGLSELLRYALSAGERSWVKVSEELAFVADYLALQRMRYGARLQLTIEGDDAAVRDGDCPPLLLQPLVENALRHDLDCHDHGSDIRLALACRDGQLFIHISNPLHGKAHNPGVGLGLRNISARLQLAYGSAASISAGVHEGRFDVHIRIPQHGAE